VTLPDIAIGVSALGYRRTTAASGACSLPMLRAWHVDLLTGYEKLAPEVLLPQARAMRDAATACGAWIEDPEDRDAAQAILDYWTAAIGSLPNQRFPSLTRIAPFDAGNIRLAEESAENCVGALSGDGEAIARDLILNLVDHKPIAEAAPPDALGEQAAILARLEQANVVCRLPAGGGFVLTHESLLKAHWPRLARWLAERDVQRATLRSFVASAEMWDHERRQSGYLLYGSKLRAAENARGSNALLDAYLDASRKEERARRRHWIEGTLALAVLVGALLLGVELWNKTQRAQQVASARTQLSEEARKEQAQVVQQLAPASITPVTQGRPGGEGYIWIGSPSAPLLAAKPHASTWIDPSTVTVGQHYWLRTWIVLRQAYPNAIYTSATSLGSLAPDTEVIALDRPQAFNRVSGTQYWLKVRQVVRTFVQYSGDKTRVDALLKRLVNAGYAVPPAEYRPDWRGKLQVRYYRESDRQLAEALIRTLYANLAATGRPIAPSCRSFAVLDPKPPPGVLEAWVDLDAFTPTGDADAPTPLPRDAICAPAPSAPSGPVAPHDLKSAQ
jgi:hypothetical protein